MQKTRIDRLRPGDVLGKTLYNVRGDLLLASGVALTRGYIEALREQGYYAVYIRDGLADDLEPPDLLADRVRMSTYKHVRDLYALVETATMRHPQQEQQALSEMAESGMPQLADINRDVERIVEEVSSIATISGVVSLKSHDNYTFEHSIDVAVAGIMLGSRLGLAEDHLRQLALGCLCHDIGKALVSPETLHKPGRLTPEEIEEIKLHPSAGYQAVRGITSPDDVIARQVVWQHHEHQDGSGYPRGLVGCNRLRMRRGGRMRGSMHPAAEIGAVADVYSALSSDRPYRLALSPEAVVSTMRAMAGTHLNSALVDGFLSMLPTYSVGTHIVITSGRLEGFRGVVANINQANLHRPIVRVLLDSKGEPIAPIELDLSAEREMQIAASPYDDFVPHTQHTLRVSPVTAQPPVGGLQMSQVESQQ